MKVRRLMKKNKALSYNIELLHKNNDIGEKYNVINILEYPERLQI